jgi:hypothetical protein
MWGQTDRHNEANMRLPVSRLARTSLKILFLIDNFVFPFYRKQYKSTLVST